MIRRFLTIWLAYWATVFILPLESIYDGTGQAFLLQLFFVLLIAAMTLGLGAGIVRFDTPVVLEIQSARLMARYAFALAVLGLLALLIDRVVVQQIDYAAGIADAREQLRRAGEQRTSGTSSIFSMIGYLLGSCYFVSVILAITQHTQISPRERNWHLLGASSLALLGSAIDGGRSTLLVLVVTIFVAMALRRRATRVRFSFGRKRTTLAVFFFLAIFTWYPLFVFFARASTNDLDIATYMDQFLPHLGLRPSAWFSDGLPTGLVGDITAATTLLLGYLTHSFATTAAIVSNPTGDETIAFLHVHRLAFKLGWAAFPNGDWFLAGRFPSTPGAFWYQFGPLGFIGATVALGIFAALARILLTFHPHSAFMLGFYVLAESTLLLTPAILALDFMSFPFIGLSFIIVPAPLFLLRLYSRKVT